MSRPTLANMSNDTILTDDYVAELLARDAKDCSLKYSAMGMEAFRDAKKPSNLPKPNTRFLHNIIKGTDQHNKALLAKETAESKARLRSLEHGDEPKGRKTRATPNGNDMRRRQMSDIQAILVGKKKRKIADDDSETSSRRNLPCEDRRRETKRARTEDDDLIKHRGTRRDHGRLIERDDCGSSSRTKQDTRSASDMRSSVKEESRTRGDDISKRQRSPSPRHRKSSRSLDEEIRSRVKRSRHRSRRKSPSPQPTRKRSRSTERDSDPLDDLIGPPPPPKMRGRGTIGGAAALDRRFSESYDPKTDVQMDEEEEHWDEAVEMFRDWQKSKLHQDQRLKEVGFTDEQIQQASGAGQKTQASFLWTKTGETREWDKNKNIDSSGAEDEPVSKQPTLFSNKS